MAAFPTTPHGAGPATGDIGPAVINVRRPRLGPSEAPISAELVLASVDGTLPPTVLRLPNLAALPGPPSTLNKVFSILHWCFIGLGSLVALWLIFGGRGGPKPTGDEAPAAPARAQVDARPVFNSPKLDTAGDSDAPKWTPPAATVSPSAEASGFVPPSGGFTHSHPPAATPAPAAETPAVETEVPSHESWPQGSSVAPPVAPAAESPMPETPTPEMPSPAAAPMPETPAAPQPGMPAAPAWQGASNPPVGAPAGPVARTAAREMPAAAPAPGGEAHPLDLTVPVPQ